jgi:WD40 repeat protein
MVEDSRDDALWTGPREDPHRYRVDLGEEGLVSVGDGGEGLVYRAIRTVDGISTDVALKLLTSLTLDDYARLATRSAVVASIDHPNVMRQIETFEGSALLHHDQSNGAEFDVLYSVAEWIPGEPMADALPRAGTAIGLAWVAQIARGVHALHSYRSGDAPDGIIHRDVKPSNVRIDSDGNAKLIDFGIARPQTGTEHTDGIGTYLWRAPEVIGGPGKPGILSDNWGVGALAYWVLTAEAPRLEGAAAARERIVHSQATNQFPNPRRLATHVAGLLETHPDARPSDLMRWADRTDLLTGRSLRTGGRRWRDHLRLPSGELWHRKRRAIRIGAVVLSILLVATLVTLWTNNLNRRVGTQSEDLLSGEVASEASTQLSSTSSSNVVTGMLLSIEAADLAPTSSARLDLINSLKSPVERVLQGRGSFTADAISPDGKTLAAGNTDGSVQLRSMSTGKKLGPDMNIARHQQVNDIAFDSDDKFLAIGMSAFKQEQGLVVLRSIGQGRALTRRLPVDGIVTSLEFSPTDQTIAVGTQGTNVYLWNWKTNIVKKLEFTTNIFTMCHFFNIGLELECVSDNGSAEMWNAESGASIVSLPMNTISNDSNDATANMAFSPVGSTLAVADGTGRIALFDPQTGAKLRQLVSRPVWSAASFTNALSFSPDGKTLAEADSVGNIQLINTARGSQIGQTFGSGSPTASVAFDPTGATLVSATQSGQLDFWKNGSSVYPFIDRRLPFGPSSVVPNGGGGLSFSDENPILMAGFEYTPASSTPTCVSHPLSAPSCTGFNQSGGATLWNLRSHTSRTVALHDSGTISDVGMSPNGQMLATADSKGVIRIWKVSTKPHLLMSLRDANHAGVSLVAFSPDGTTLAAGETNGMVVLWNLQDRNMIVGPKLSGRGGGPRTFSFSSNGSELAAGDAEGNLILWDVDTNSKISQPAVGSFPSGQPVQNVDFSPRDNALAAAIGDNLYLVDGQAPRSMGAPLSTSPNGYAAVTFSPNGDTLFASDGTAKISFWDAAARQQMGQIDASNGVPSAFAFASPLQVSPNGQTLAVDGWAGVHGQLRDVTTLYPSSDWGEVSSSVSKLCNELGTNLTRSQWAEYVPGQPYQAVCKS